MAWVKTGTRADGTTAHTVRYVLGDGTQTSATFDVAAAAAEFCDTVNAIGPDKAMLAWGIAPTTHKPRSRKPTVATWVRRYIDSRTGVVNRPHQQPRRRRRHGPDPHRCWGVAAVHVSIGQHESSTCRQIARIYFDEGSSGL